jgi:hypothetical protein
MHVDQNRVGVAAVNVFLGLLIAFSLACHLLLADLPCKKQ